MSFNTAQEDKTKKLVSDPLMSPGFMSITTTDALDHSRKGPVGDIQVWYYSISFSGYILVFQGLLKHLMLYFG